MQRLHVKLEEEMDETAMDFSKHIDNLFEAYKQT
jgi:hypothetical protein